MAALLSSECVIPLRMWKDPAAPEMIGKARLILDQALRSKGVVTVIQHAPSFVESYITEDGVEIGPHYLLAADGISICVRDGHEPYKEPIRSFLCSRCRTVIDQTAYEAFAAVAV